MNTKIWLGIGVLVVVLAGGFFFLKSSPASAPSNTATQEVASTTPQVTKAPVQPTFTTGTTDVKIVQSSARAAFDPRSLTSTSTYPVITGTANVPKISITVYDREGVGIVSASNIQVKDGHWTYYCSAKLVAGKYMLIVMAEDVSVRTALTVQNP
ncbi:MAG: hypothetical protein WCS97_03245 [Candidatus Paceibacterota bacterium]|jgi:hypothetical protein